MPKRQAYQKLLCINRFHSPLRSKEPRKAQHIRPTSPCGGYVWHYLRLNAEQKNVKHRFEVIQFESQVCNHMVSLHHAHKRTDIRQNGKDQCGYARVVLRDGNYVEPSSEPIQPELVPF